MQNEDKTFTQPILKKVDKSINDSFNEVLKPLYEKLGLKQNHIYEFEYDKDENLFVATVPYETELESQSFVIEMKNNRGTVMLYSTALPEHPHQTEILGYIHMVDGKMVLK